MNRAAEPDSAQSLLRQGAHYLERAGIAQARREAEWLLSRLMGLRPLELYLEECDITGRITKQFFSRIAARIAGSPLQYILGETEFCGTELAVRPGVFIPRPETEAIVEAAVAALRARERQAGRPLRLLDAGTGSGCIAIALARALPTCVVVGVEVSWDALRIARDNVVRRGLASRVWLVQGHLDEPISGGFDGIVSNPPYVPSGAVDQLPLDVRGEPRLSLDGGSDGLAALIRLLDHASRLLRPEGLLILESAEDQVEPLMRRARGASWVRTVQPVQDLAGRPRGVIVRHG